MTEFFRDPALYEELRVSILPRLMDEAVSNGGELRIWSAGSSTGEEAYSLAMLCAEILPDDHPQVRIFATDIDEDAIAFARRGVYGREAIRDVPAELVQRYFMRLCDSYEVGKRIRNMTVFGQHDLAQRAPFPRIDMVLCRNVLIYFTKELQTRALQLFAFALRDNGYLVLGRAESTTPLAQYFQVANAPLKIYQRMGERILIPPTRFKDLPAIETRIASATSSLLPRAGTPSRHAELRPTAAETVGRFVFGSMFGVVVVDRRYDILTLNPAARSMLQIHGVGVGDDLIHSAQGIDREQLRNAVDAAFRGETPEPIDLEIDTELNEKKTVRVTCCLAAEMGACIAAALEKLAIPLRTNRRGVEESKPPSFSCPDCGGVLWEQDEEGLLHFRCPTGHSYSPSTLYARQDDGLEEALWSAVRALEERAEMSDVLAKRLRARGLAHAAQRLERQANVARERSETVRKTVTDLVTRRDSEEADQSSTGG